MILLVLYTLVKHLIMLTIENCSRYFDDNADHQIVRVSLLAFWYCSQESFLRF